MQLSYSIYSGNCIPYLLKKDCPSHYNVKQNRVMRARRFVFVQCSVSKEQKRGWKRAIYACVIYIHCGFPLGKFRKNPLAIILMTKMGTMSSVTIFMASPMKIPISNVWKFNDLSGDRLLSE